jgi:hypothetical protein
MAEPGAETAQSGAQKAGNTTHESRQPGAETAQIGAQKARNVTPESR